MGGKQTKSRQDYYFTKITIKAYQKAKLMTRRDGTQAFVSNWNNPKIFEVEYASYDSPYARINEIMQQIKAGNMMIYDIEVDTDGRMPRIEIMNQLESIVEEFRSLFPPMKDDTQPAARLSIVYNGIVSLPLLRLRKKGIKIYTSYGDPSDKMEYPRQDVNFVSPVFADDDMSKMPMLM